MSPPLSPYLERLRGRIDLQHIPFSERGSRLLVFRRAHSLYIRLAERWMKWESQVGHYRVRPPVVDDIELMDEKGAPLEFTCTAYPHAVRFETRLGEFWLTFLEPETLYLTLPPRRGGVRFRCYALDARTDRRGGEFKGDPEHLIMPRNVGYTTNAKILSNTVSRSDDSYMHVALEYDAPAGSAFTLNITPRLGLRRTIPPPDEVLAAAEQRWHQWFAATPPVADRYASQYYYAWWILRAGLLSSRFYLTREAMMPSIIHYVGVWAWDAFFHALAYRYVDRELAENQLRVLLDHQRTDGMLPDAIHDEGVIFRWPLPDGSGDAEVTKPPLIAWTALKLYEVCGNRDFLDEIYEPIVRWNRWWFECNDPDRDGIVQYNHPNSSGLDDSPLWDGGMPVDSPDLNTYLVMQMDALARMAEILGLEDDAAQWRARAAEHTARLVKYFWDEQAGVFWARRNREPIPVLTPFNLYPLLTGRLDARMCRRLIEHLTSPAEFWTEYPIPTVARSDPHYNPNQMWRGPTWVNINYLFIEGLARAGFLEQAYLLRDKTLDLLMRHADLFEYYNPETGSAPPGAASLFGWSSAVFVDLAIQASRDKLI